MAKPLKVLHVIPDLRKGGAERLAIDICRGLQSIYNAECCLVTLKPANEYLEISKEIRVECIPSKYIPSVSGKSRIETVAFNQFIDDFKPDIIHSHLFEAELVAHQRTVKGVKYVSHLHDNMFQFKKPVLTDLINKKRLTELYERNLILSKYKNCNKRFIAISKDVEAYFKTNLPSGITRFIHLINNGFFYSSFENNRKREKCSSPAKLLTIGSLVNKKNQAYLIPVVRELIKRNIAVELNMLGNGPNLELIRKTISEEGLEKHIFMRGNVNNVPEYLQNSDLYLHPATYEPFGLAILEAMASGLPCVTLNGRGNLDIIEHKKNGFVFEKQNREEYIETIISLIQNQELFQKISMEGKARSRDFDMPKYIEKIFKLYLD